MGRTGVITPVAEFEPVLLAGTSVSRASLHNADRLLELDLHSGDTIVVRKAGEIIPEVVRVLPELRPAAYPTRGAPEHLPSLRIHLGARKQRSGHALRQQQLPRDPAWRPAPLGQQGGHGCGWPGQQVD